MQVILALKIRKGLFLLGSKFEKNEKKIALKIHSMLEARDKGSISLLQT